VTGHRPPPFTSVRFAERRRWRTAVRVGVLVVVLAVLGTAAAGLFSVVYAVTRIDGTAVAGLERSDGTATNVLVVLVSEEGAEADGIAVVQVAETRPAPAVLVLPTRLRVTLLGEGTRPLVDHHTQGGIPLLVDAVSEYTGLELQHYVEVDVAALAAGVDRLGGVPECPEPPTEVCPTLVGAEVLERLAAPADGAVSGPERVQAVVSVLSAVAAAADGTNPVLSPITTKRLVDGVVASVRSDADLGPLPARRIARFAGVEPEVRVVPGIVVDGLVSAEPEQTAALLQSLVEVAPWPSEVRVRVLNGIGRAGIASATADALEQAGFEVVETGNAEPFDPNALTSIQHGPGAAPLAELVAEALGFGMLEEIDEAPTGAEIVVVVGTDGPGR
jgi:polyisoprenyl-teichoic acid--peptidoglycan teichoic acid transferase